MNLNPILMKRGFDIARDKILEYLEEIKLPTRPDDLYNISLISTNNDKKMSELI